jgi:hypothetical protein
MTTAGRVAIDLRIIGRRLPGLRWRGGLIPRRG